MKYDAHICIPSPHKNQEVFTDWEEMHPNAQCLVAPGGTKSGKTFGSSLWLLSDSLVNENHYDIWVAPTLYKCKIGYRYMKAMLPEAEFFAPKDSSLEIWFGNGSFIKFLHGHDAEVTVEGEAIDGFVIEEAGKQRAQLWYSTFTTITQTEGHGIVTGTPRGRTWYYDIYQKALRGDPFFCHAKLPTSMSPFVKPQAIERAKRLLPPALFMQYYMAEFVSDSSVYGDLSGIWNELPVSNGGFWIHPDPAARAKPVIIGFDLAKRNDYTCAFALNHEGETVGYFRLRQKTYQDQCNILGRFATYFTGVDNELRYDRTGVGDAVGEVITQVFDRHHGDWAITPVVFTNAVKQEMVSRAQQAIETGWWKCPRIPRVEHEFVNLEVTATKTGLHTYSAPSGEHDDVHWAAALAIHGAHVGVVRGSQMDMIEAALSGKLLTNDDDDEEEEFRDELLEEITAQVGDEDVLTDIGEMH